MPAAEQTPALLIIVSGPAGSGKTTVCDCMIEAFSPGLQRVITSTTRAPRQGEEHGKDYYFFTDEEFEERVKAGQFYEWAPVHNHSYGCLKSDITDKLNRNIDLLLNIDVQGAATIRRAAEVEPRPIGRMLSVFIMPGSIEQLRERLLSRGQDDKAEIERRLQTARKESADGENFDYRIITGTRDEDFNRLRDIYMAEKTSSSSSPSSS